MLDVRNCTFISAGEHSSLFFAFNLTSLRISVNDPLTLHSHPSNSVAFSFEIKCSVLLIVALVVEQRFLKEDKSVRNTKNEKVGKIKRSALVRT